MIAEDFTSPKLLPFALIEFSILNVGRNFDPFYSRHGVRFSFPTILDTSIVRGWEEVVEVDGKTEKSRNSDSERHWWMHQLHAVELKHWL